MQRHRHSFARHMVFFIALLATALAMGAALAHALELPNKIGLTQEQYFTVQQIYAGWNRLAYLLAIELLGIVAVIVLYRRDKRVMIASSIALGSFIAAQIIFWIWTFPANSATQNWTVQPENWEILRMEWEYSHLAGAFFQVLAMASLIVAALARKE